MVCGGVYPVSPVLVNGNARGKKKKKKKKNKKKKKKKKREGVPGGLALPRWASRLR
jgi:hypothetical protein